MEFGISQGRFHMIHKGHMEYLLASAERCDFLYVGVSDPDPQRAYFRESYNQDTDIGAEPMRGVQNPIFTFTYFERAMMITEALAEAGVARDRFAVVPFPVHLPNLLKYYVPTRCKMFVTIYDVWGEQKAEIFKDMGYTVDILWRRTMAERFTTATEVRERIAAKEPWEHLVPDAVARVIRSLELDRTLGEMSR